MKYSWHAVFDSEIKQKLRTISMADMFFLFILFYAALDSKGFCQETVNDQRGPAFRNEPPARLEFSNTAGTELRCVVDGSPNPRVHWYTREGVIADDVPGLRYQRLHIKDSSGTLVFPPFSRPEYQQEIHDAVYQCVASNDFGTIISREVHVKAVVKQRFSPQVYDEYVTRGNTAVLRCHLPSFAKEHVIVDAWIRNDRQIFKASTEEQARGRSFYVLRSGELLIHDVQEKDTSWKYRCQTRHKLTGELVLSETEGKIIVTEPHASTLPNFIFKGSQVRADEGLPTELPCVAQGNPPPTYRWVKEVSGRLVPVDEDDARGGVYIKRGVLTFGRVQRSDSGQYQCIARNSIGERRVDTSLQVTAPLSVSVRPQRLELTLGQEATLNCNITGYPLHHVNWMKDRKPVDSTRVRLITKQVLHIPAVGRQDKGIYQCFAINDRDSSQGASQIYIADAPPILISVFSERSVVPGEWLSMRCVASGNPVPTISWYLDDDTIVRNRPRIAISDYITEPEGHVVSYLNISEARLEDGGEYRCQANNEVGFTSHGERLNVRGPPFIRPMRNATAISRKELVLRCPYGGHPIRAIQWFKDGGLLPSDILQKSNLTGTYNIESVEREVHEGRYTCVVKHADGQSASGATYVTVVVSPVIEPSHLRDTITVNEKSRTKLMCVVNEGDPPLQFRWFKNGQPFLAHGETTVQTFEDTSMVTFKRVASADRGRYMCVVSNKAASTNRTTELVVNVPPQWIIEPKNNTAVLGMKTWLDCSATGHPPPNTLWKKISHPDIGADFSWIRSSPRTHRFNNGTLTLTDVREEDAGSYLCQAHNGIGPALTKIIFLKVLVPPRFKDNFQKKKTITEGHDAILSCSAEGDQPIEVIWRKDDTEITSSSNNRYSIRRSMGDSEISSELLIIKTSREEDSGIFTCIATSEFGKDETSRQLVVQGVPDPPTDVIVTDVGSRSVTLKWDVPHDGNAQGTGSVIQYKAEPESDWTSGQASELIVSGPDSSATLRSLSPITTYFVRIVAENTVGRSLPSDTVNLTTLEEAPTGAPRDVAVHSTGAQSMKVSWKPPPEDTRNGRIRGYYVGYRQSSFADPYHFQKVDLTTTSTDDDHQHSTYITGLKPFTQYDIVVRAFNSIGNGPKSSRVIGRTLETAPPTSPTVQVSSTSSSTVDISWEKNSRDKSAITEYTLHYKAEGDAEWSRERLGGELDRYALNGLKCGTRYSLYVTASNSLGTGEPSTPVTARTKGSAPMSPKMERFLWTNSTSAALQFDAWQSMGCAIKSFTVQHRPKHKTTQWIKQENVDSGRTNYLIQSLSPGRDYVLLVTAHSEAGATQGEYHFRTSPLHNSSSGPSSFPAYGMQPENDYQQPFYRNVALVIPVVVSSLLLVIVAFAVAVCLRKQAQDRRERIDYEANPSKQSGDSLMMREVNRKKTVYAPSPKSTHYAIPSGKVKKAEYAEPYVCDSTGRQGSDGLFATIKRGPSRPLHMSAQQKTADTST